MMIKSMLLIQNNYSSISKLIPKLNSELLCQQFSRLCVAKPPLLCLKENNIPTQHTRNYGSYNSDLQTNSSLRNILWSYSQSNSLLSRNVKMSLVNCNPTRNLTRISKTGKTRTVRMVTQRFRRLGNGLWIYRNPGYNRGLWRKALKPNGAKYIRQAKNHVFCNKWQTKRLDKMVSKYWKTNKWYVDDPYKGYTEHSYHFYHPMDLPWNSLRKPDDHYEYSYNRMKKLYKSRTPRKHRQGPGFMVRSHRQKHVPTTFSNHLCRG